MIRTLLLFIVMFTLSGCGVYDSHRPTQTIRFQAPALGTKALSATYEFKQRKERIELKESDGVYQIDIPPMTWGGMMLLFIPLGDDPSDEEILSFQAEGAEIKRLTVRDFLDSKNSDFEIIDRYEHPFPNWNPTSE